MLEEQDTMIAETTESKIKKDGPDMLVKEKEEST